jgi:aspartate carbamoyltransferase
LEKDFSGRHILSVNQFSRDDLKLLFDTAREMKFLVRKRGTISLLKGKILATLFYEPSTRTSLSFVAAMQRLGGTVIQCHENISSIQKGETLQDTVRTLENYADVIVLRHPEKGSAQQAAKVCHKPVINAGDGVGEHPTQALLDVFTIREELGTVNGLNIAFVGDLKHGRTVHSLVQLLSHYHVNCLYYVSPASLKIPEEIVSSLTQKGIKQVQLESLDSIIGELNVLYVTRIQKERFANLVEFEKVKDSFYIGPKLLQKAKDSMIVMHPLPRNQELDPAVDSDPRAAYFREMENGMFVRMALLALILGKN